MKRAVLEFLILFLMGGDACLWGGEGLPEIANGSVAVRAVEADGAWAGFDVLADGKMAAAVRLSSGRILRARRCEVGDEGRSLRFGGLIPREGTGLRLGEEDGFRVDLKPGDPYPAVSFDLRILEFSPEKWKKAVGEEPFHFLALFLRDADAWHQRGWLNATPLADPFPLLLDRHVGTPEISAYHYNRSWSYTPPLGACPIPLIGLWASPSGRYVGLEFQTTRLRENTEKDIATGYRWVEGKDGSKEEEGQFVSLVYPHGGQGYQRLVFPEPGARIRSRGTLLYSLDLPAARDPNQFFWEFLWPRDAERLPRVPAVVDLSWIPGGIRLKDFAGPPGGRLIGGVEQPFQVPGTRLISGWTWHNESPTAAPVKLGNSSRLRELEEEARELLRLAKRFREGGEECVFWEKPLQGEWTPEWGGKPATTLHNANGFAAGRVFLGLYRDLGKEEYLPVVDGVFNWAKRIAWTRNEFADVPSSPFAIGGTLSASFCLEYFMAFRDSPDGARRERAKAALGLARAFTYRYMTLWPSDSDLADNLDPSFLWEPNSGRDWAGAACANEVFWNLDTLAQTAVHTGDPVLLWALQGSLSRWHQLYQEVYKEKLADYQPADMTEGFGLFAGNVYGVGARAAYGFASPLFMAEPVGGSSVRVLAGEKAALAFGKGTRAISISGYRYTHPGNLSFILEGGKDGFDLSLTVPYVDLSAKAVARIRGGKREDLRPGEDFLRPPQALWSLYFRGLNGSDRVVVGEPGEGGPVLPSSPPLVQEARIQRTPGDLGPGKGFEVIPIPFDGSLEGSWDRLDSWAGLSRGLSWYCGIPFALERLGGKDAASKSFRLERPIAGPGSLHILYGAGDGPPPAVLLEDGKVDSLERLEVLAWRAWPPIYTARLILARIAVPRGVVAAGLDPAGRPLLALTLFRPSGDGGDREKLEILPRLVEASKEWLKLQREEKTVRELTAEGSGVPPGSIAILPPRPSGPTYGLIQRAGLMKRCVALAPGDLVEPGSFHPGRFKATLYLGGEDYVHTVRSAGDGAEALVRYVKEGGTLLVLPTGPWPFFYADGPGFHRAEALTERLGLPLAMTFEEAPRERLSVKVDPAQKIVAPESGEFPYPEGDPRLRCIERNRIPAGARYTPLAKVVGSGGKDYGDAAGLIEFSGGGRILYISYSLLRDPRNGSPFLEGALRFLLEAAKRK